MGGKSRKKGGVSKELIDQLKRGNCGGSKSCGGKKDKGDSLGVSGGASGTASGDKGE